MGKFKEFLKVASLLVVCIGIPVIGWELLRVVRDTPDGVTPNPTYAELVTIILTAVTVVLAALAIIVAILAVWGYQGIKSQAIERAEQAIEKSLSELVKKHANDDSIKKLLAKEVRQRYGSLVVSTAELYPEAFNLQPDGPEQGTVGNEYPRGDAPEG